ncbi:hypothetical protein BGY98DRAFT_478960 [Russula aff. rugulosa BPL654]|nr:hypothetical protein BGY98DRAFT_478960 [Russula aff. rugulosa BPL654]
MSACAQMGTTDGESTGPLECLGLGLGLGLGGTRRTPTWVPTVYPPTLCISLVSAPNQSLPLQLLTQPPLRSTLASRCRLSDTAFCSARRHGTGRCDARLGQLESCYRDCIDACIISRTQMGQQAQKRKVSQSMIVVGVWGQTVKGTEKKDIGK